MSDPDPGTDDRRDDPGDIERLVQRAIATITAITRRATGFALRMALVVTVVCGGVFLLGLAALDGGIETVWIVLALCFGSIALGAAAVAWWRIGSIRRHVPELVTDVRTLLSNGQGTARTVIESFVVDDDAPDRGDGFGAGSVVVFTRRLNDVRGLAGGATESSARLAATLTAITSFPALVLVAVAITVCFLGLGAIFLLALALG